MNMKVMDFVNILKGLIYVLLTLSDLTQCKPYVFCYSHTKWVSQGIFQLKHEAAFHQLSACQLSPVSIYSVVPMNQNIDYIFTISSYMASNQYVQNYLFSISSANKRPM